MSSKFWLNLYRFLVVASFILSAQPLETMEDNVVNFVYGISVLVEEFRQDLEMERFGVYE